jgi:uncharacterized membrane protein
MRSLLVGILHASQVWIGYQYNKMLVAVGIIIILIGFIVGLGNEQSTVLIIIGIAAAMAGIIGEFRTRPYPS